MSPKLRRCLSATLLVGFVFFSFQATVEAAFLDFLTEENQTIVPPAQRTKLVSMLVEERLLDDDDLQPKIERYARDVQAAIDGKVVLIAVPDENISPLDIFEGNAHLYFSGYNSDGLSQLVGTILIGKVPLPVVEKNGNLWPTIYPYVDLEKTSYLWDKTKKRFVYQGGGDEEPEIWHGVIRSDIGEGEGYDVDDLADLQEEQLSDYFDSNHAVHQGTTTFAKKIFYMDLPRQREGMNNEMKERYANYIEHIEDAVYLRFNKHWFTKLLNNSNLNEAVPWDILPDDARPASPPDLSEDGSKIPDIQSKYPIENFLKRYFESWKNYLSQINTTIETTNRWDGGDVDTTITLVTRKDEAAALFLKDFNDALETELREQLNSQNIATDISVPDTTDILFTETVAQPYGKPLYWNGVERSSMDAEDCSLLRGSPRDDSHPYAQMVEANRTYDVRTAEESFESPLCEHSSASQEAKDADPYAGCCALNLSVNTNDFSYSYDTCNTGSQWVNESNHRGAEKPVLSLAGTTEKLTGNQGSQGCSSIIDIFNEDPDVAHRFESLMIHDEPRPETLTAQVEAMATTSLPVDDPRGFSFYDHAKEFHRLDYFNIFDLRELYTDATESERKLLLKTYIQEKLIDKLQEINTITQKGNSISNARLADDSPLEWPGTKCTPPIGFGCHDGLGTPIDYDNCRTYEKSITNPDSYTTRIDWTEDCTWTQWGDDGGEPPIPLLLDTTSSSEKIVRFYETGDDISEGLFGSILNNYSLDRLVENIIWLDKDIEDKNREAFEKAFGPVADARIFFFDNTFDGYELTEILAESAESDVITHNGFQMLFEQGESTGEETFASNQRKASRFQFQTSSNQTFLGKDFESAFLGKDAIEEKCGSDDFIAQMNCYAQETEKNSSESIRVLTKEGEKPVVISPFDEKNSLDQVSGIRITPSQINISSQDVNTIPVEVSLINKAGTTVLSDFSSEVSLHFDSSDIEKFFNIQPSSTQITSAGKATFYLVPRTSEVGGKFLLWAKTGNIKSKEIEIQINKFSLLGFADKRELPVQDEEGTLLRIQLRENEKEIVSVYDGKVIEFTSSWGSFENNGKAVLENGRTEIRFFPGSRAGKGIVSFQDQDKKLPSQTIKINILADKPADLIFDVDSPYLVRNENFSPIQVYLVDQFGNKIQETSQTLHWSGNGLEIQGSNNSSEILVRPKPDVQKMTLDVESSFFPEKTFSQNFSLLQNGLLRTNIPVNELEVGNKDPIKILVWGETVDGERISGNFEVGIINEPGGIGIVPPSVELQNGLGEFELQSGTRAGTMHIKLVSPGFEADSFSLEVKPTEAQKILLSSNRNTLDLNGSENMKLTIGIVDKFGNTVSQFSDKVVLNVNETKQITSSDVDTLKELGVIEESESEQFYLENQSSSGITTPANTIVSIEDGQAVTFLEGEKNLKLTPQTNPGKVFLSTESNALIPATTSFDVTKYFTISHLRSLTPKSLVTFILGFGGGDMNLEQNVGNAYLFEGTTQSVATLISDPEPEQRIGFVSYDGKISDELNPEFRFGDFADIELFGPDRLLAQMRLLFPITPELKVVRKNGTQLGMYFIPEENLSSDIEVDDQTLFFVDQPIFSVSEEGGIHLDAGNVEFIPQKDSILTWEVAKSDQKLGTLSFVLESTQVHITDSIETSLKNSGFLFESKAFDIQIESGFTGMSTSDPKGVFLINPSENESQNRILGSSRPSAEDAKTGEEDIVWKDEWKPGTLWAGGNSFGEATQWAGSDAFILLGDPTITVGSANTKNSLDITDDIGTQLWKSHDGPIDQILSGDINGDGYEDIFVLTGNILNALYQDDTESDNFRDTGPILRFGDGVRALVEFDNDEDGFSDLLQVNDSRETLVHKNTIGTYAREDIDLGLEKEIVKIQGANLNGDNYRDLVVLDTDNCIWKILGIPDTFGTPEQVYCFPSSLEKIEEEFIVSENQEEGSEYFNADTFTYLDNFYVDYAGLENKLLNIPEEAQRDSCSRENLDRTFVAVTSNPRLDATLELSQNQEETDPLTIIPGTKITARVTVTPDITLEDFELVVPPFLGMDFVEGSLTCEGCQGEVLEQKPNCDGAFLFTGVDLPGGNDSVFEWTLEVGELPEVKYFVDDYFEKDGLDDILIPFTEKKDGVSVNRIAKFAAPPHNLELQTVESLVTSILEDFTGDDGNGGSNSGISVAETLLAPLKADSDGDGYPDMFESPATESSVDAGLQVLANTIASTSCGGCGLPIINKVFLAPGFDTTYIPPIGLPGGFDPGFPVLAFPTTLYTPVGPIPFLWPPSPTGRQFIEGPFNSFFRMYVAPTTTGSVGLAMCLGSYPVNMVSPVFFPTCFVVAPSILGALGVCPANPNSGVGGMNFGGSWNSANYTPKVKVEISNQKIESADIVTRWIDKQYEALADITMPSVNLKTPDLSPQDETESALQTEGDVFEKANNSPFINIKKKKVVISYPSVTDQDVDLMKEDYTQWKRTYDSWREDAQSKIDNYEGPPEIKTQALDYLSKADEVPLNIEKNISTVESYNASIAALKETPEKIKKGVEAVVNNAAMTSDYFSNWFESTQKSVESWGKFRMTFKNILKTWESIPQIFQNFSMNCPSCSVDRGTMHEWLLRILLSGVDFPVLQPPKLPNVNLDFSGLNFGNDVTIPEITFEPVQLDIFSLPDDLPPLGLPPKLKELPTSDDIILPSVSYPSFPPLPNIPNLPGLPHLSLDVALPTLSLPPLPTIPSPPGIPDILSPVETIVQIPKVFINLTCLLVMGIAPVPEWHVKAYVQQLTNRTKLFDLDFSGAALTVPSLSVSAGLSADVGSDINIKIENNYTKTLEAFQMVDQLAETSQKAVDAISKTTKTPISASASLYEPLTETVQIPLPYANLTSVDFSENLKNISLQESELIFVREQKEKMQNILAQSNEKIFLEKEKGLLAGLLDSFVPKNTSSLVSSIPNGIGRWLTSTIDVGLIPTTVPSGFDMDKFEAEQTKIQEEPSIYYYDGPTETYSKVTQFPIPEKYAYWFTDLRGNDQIKELLYSLDNELYLKYRTVPLLSKEQQNSLEDRYEETRAEEYEDRHSEILEWTWEEFAEKFVPVLSAFSETDIKGFAGNFERMWNDVFYFEWVVSDRPDHIFEIGEESVENKKSKLWDRNGFLIRTKTKKYEIRPMTTKVKKITGSPILYASPLEEIPLLTQEDCENSSVEKPFYATESVLLGVKDNSRMEIRVPPRQGQEEEFREIVLHAGEETMVEYAEVCLTRGAVERVSTEEVEKIEPRRNLYLPEGARFELGPNDKVEIELFDGTIVPLYGGEKYSVRYFESKDNVINFFKNLSLGNHYGFFQSFGREGESYIIPEFIHDPQPSDDTTPPVISVAGGVNITANVFQPVSIDASATYDDQALKRVWWDLLPEIDSDQDGDSTNDPNFEGVVENMRDLLNVRLPAYEQTGTFEVVLNVEDGSGNIAQETLSITVSAPEVSVYQASLRDKNIIGKIENGESGFPVYILREREGSGESLLEVDPLLTQQEGNFDLSSLKDSGGLEIKDQEGNTVVEILPNGRPIRIDERFGFTLQKATPEHPFRIIVHDQTGASLAYISFTQNGENDVVILSQDVDSVPEGVWIRDTNKEDRYEFKSLPYQEPFISGGAALIDSQEHKTLGFLDPRGDFYLSEGVSAHFEIQRAVNQSDPVIFNISLNDQIVGEFGVGSKGELSPQVEIPQGLSWPPMTDNFSTHSENTSE